MFLSARLANVVWAAEQTPNFEVDYTLIRFRGALHGMPLALRRIAQD
jgi:hypothetical protein